MKQALCGEVISFIRSTDKVAKKDGIVFLGAQTPLRLINFWQNLFFFAVWTPSPVTYWLLLEVIIIILMMISFSCFQRATLLYNFEVLSSFAFLCVNHTNLCLACGGVVLCIIISDHTAPFLSFSLTVFLIFLVQLYRTLEICLSSLACFLNSSLLLLTQPHGYVALCLSLTSPLSFILPFLTSEYRSLFMYQHSNPFTRTPYNRNSKASLN